MDCSLCLASLEKLVNYEHRNSKVRHYIAHSSALQSPRWSSPLGPFSSLASPSLSPSHHHHHQHQHHRRHHGDCHCHCHCRPFHGGVAVVWPSPSPSAHELQAHQRPTPVQKMCFMWSKRYEEATSCGLRSKKRIPKNRNRNGFINKKQGQNDTTSAIPNTWNHVKKIAPD